jgi:membrane-associated phospholipid phosphatase
LKQDPSNPLPEAIAPKPTRHWRARVFQVYVASATLAFLALVILARGINYFPLDLSITRAIQSFNNTPSFFAVMWAVSFAGFAPQTIVITAAIILLIFASGLRWEAIVATLAALGSTGLGTLVKFIVHRPRPTADLVLVFRTLDSYSFPSGHVLFYTAFFGFLLFLTYSLLKPSFTRGLALVILAGFIVLVGPSRIYLGGHWASDVIGGYLFGSLWLTLSIIVYRWGKGRFFVHQPTASESPGPTAPR